MMILTPSLVIVRSGEVVVVETQAEAEEEENINLVTSLTRTKTTVAEAGDEDTEASLAEVVADLVAEQPTEPRMTSHV